MDPTTDILSMSAVRGTLAASVFAGGSWALEVQGVPGATLHAVIEGSVELVVGERRMHMAAGDTVLLAGGDAHVLAGDPGAPARRFDPAGATASGRACTELRMGSGESTRILCAAYAQLPSATFPTYRLLPDVVLITAAQAQPVLRSSLGLLAAEIGGSDAGTRAVLDHVVNILLIAVFRSWIARASITRERPSWLRGVADPLVGKTLGLIHGEPGRPWTMAELAKAGGVSRATLGRRFAEEVGQTPADYLTAWRMEIAGRRLREGDDTLGSIARSVGYQSEYAFNRAFSRRHGCPPGRYRLAARKGAAGG